MAKAKTILDLIPERKIVDDSNAYTAQEIAEKKGLSTPRMNDILLDMRRKGLIEKVYVRRNNKIVSAYRTK